MAEMIQRLSVSNSDIQSKGGIFEIWERAWSTSEQQGGSETATVYRRSARIAARSSREMTQADPEPKHPQAENAWWDNWKSWPLALGS